MKNVFLTMVCCAVLVVGCQGEPEAPSTPELAADQAGPGPHWNVIVMAIDALRADHLGCYGYDRPTSPFMDTLAGQGVLFQNASSNSTFTCESVSSLLTGLYPSTGCTGLGWFAVPNPSVPGFAALFGDAGYSTGFFTNHPALADPLFRKGFGEQGDIDTAQWGLSGSGDELSRRALEFAQKHCDQPFLMYMHYLDPHAPYDPPDEDYLKLAPAIYPSPLKLYDQVRPRIVQLLAEGFGPGEARFDDLVTRYDAEILVADAAVKLLVDGLKELNLDDRTIVVITADHGEEFLDHGYVEHAWRLYEESVHVPLIVWAPELLSPAQYKDRVSLVNLLPTLLDLTGVASAREEFDGASLYSVASGAPAFVPPTEPIIAELLMETRSQLRSITHNGYRYHAAQRWLTPAECSEAAAIQQTMVDKYRNGELPALDVWQTVVHEELYNLEADPGEQTNLVETEPEMLETMRGLWQDYRNTVDSRCSQGPIRRRPSAPPAPGGDEETRESASPGDALDNLGYL